MSDHLAEPYRLTVLTDRLQFSVTPSNTIELVLIEDVAPMRRPLLVSGHAHQQIADHAGIPFRYYQRMLSQAPILLAMNVNHWLHEEVTTRALRIAEGIVCAFESPRARPFF